MEGPADLLGGPIDDEDGPPPRLDAVETPVWRLTSFAKRTLVMVSIESRTLSTWFWSSLPIFFAKPHLYLVEPLFEIWDERIPL
jgi:hypothetical protein